jgi:hypothetical protein
MVELEAVRFGAAPSQGVGVSAAGFVALADGTSDRGGPRPGSAYRAGACILDST